jgi:hypothetical protein
VGRISSRSQSSSGTVPIFEVDPDLLADVSPHVTRKIADTRVPCMALKTGPWTSPAAAEAFAFMVMSGAIALEASSPHLTFQLGGVRSRSSLERAAGARPRSRGNAVSLFQPMHSARYRA